MHVAERYAHGRGVLRYLSRYVKGGPLREERLQSANAQHVVFHHDGGQKRMALPTGEFISRVLWHAPEPGQHTVRHYGLYANSVRDRLDCARRQLGQSPAPAAPGANWQADLERLGALDKTRCPRCKRRLIRGASLGRGYALKPISLSSAVPSGFAQPGVEAITPNLPSITSTGPPIARAFFLRSGVTLN